jgi:hypothetical protein
MSKIFGLIEISSIIWCYFALEESNRLFGHLGQPEILGLWGQQFIDYSETALFWIPSCDTKNI